MLRRDPLADPEPLISQVYAYVAYRIGGGPDAEDVTADVFERALRYRSSYDGSKGGPRVWLVGIARRCIADHASRATLSFAEPPDVPAPVDIENDVALRSELRKAVSELTKTEQELIALRYGADLTARQIGEIVGIRTNTVEVSLHRALGRLRDSLEKSRRPEPPRRTARLAHKLDESAL